MDEAAHSEAPIGGSTGGRRISWLIYIPIFLLIYLLGLGPAAWLLEKVPASERVIQVVYAPVIYLGDKCPPFQDAVEWYVDEIWRVK